MTVTTHPLAEIIAKKLFNIESVPPAEAKRMVGRAIKAAVEYHQSEINKMLIASGDEQRSYEIAHEIDKDVFDRMLADAVLYNKIIK